MSHDVGLSDLSVTEFVSLARLGFVPRGLVVGACFFDATWVDDSGSFTGPLTSLTQAMRKARKSAVDDLTRQAQALGAEGVVGVGLDVEHHQWRGEHHVARFLAVGTAIGRDPALTPAAFKDAPSLELAPRRPFTSDLSGQDFVALVRAGYRPVALANGNCVYQLNKWSTLTFGSAEIVDYSRAYAEARETAMSHLEEDLMHDFPRGTANCPVGVVGMRVEEGRHGENANVIEFTATGTAVARLARSDPRFRSEPLDVHLVAALDR